MAEGPGGRFTKGHKRVGGRAAGTPNRSTAAVKDALVEAFDALGGVDYLVDLGRTDPPTFAGLLKTIIPREIAARIESEIELVIERNRPSRLVEPPVVEAEAKPLEPEAPPAGDGAVGHEPPPPAASSSAPRRSLELEVDESLARENDRALRSARAGRPDLFDRTSWERRGPAQGRADF